MISLKSGAPKVKIIFRAIIIEIVPTIGPIALVTKDDIIIDKEATTSIDNAPVQKAKKNLHITSSLPKTVTPLLRTIKSPDPNST